MVCEVDGKEQQAFALACLLDRTIENLSVLNESQREGKVRFPNSDSHSRGCFGVVEVYVVQLDFDPLAFEQGFDRECLRVGMYRECDEPVHFSAVMLVRPIF